MPINVTKCVTIPNCGNDIASFVGAKLSAAEKLDALKSFSAQCQLLQHFGNGKCLNGIGLFIQKKKKMLSEKCESSLALLMELLSSFGKFMCFQN